VERDHLREAILALVCEDDGPTVGEALEVAMRRAAIAAAIYAEPGVGRGSRLRDVEAWGGEVRRLLAIAMERAARFDEGVA
jgi:hypothetical protein